VTSIVDSPWLWLPSTRSPQQANPNQTGDDRCDEQRGRKTSAAKRETDRCQQKTRSEGSNSLLPEAASRRHTPAASDLPKQNHSWHDEPPWAGVSAAAERASQQDSDQGSHQERRRAHEWIAPGTAQISREKQHSCESEGKPHRVLQCHAGFLDDYRWVSVETVRRD
jgi:hypothetical protein